MNFLLLCLHSIPLLMLFNIEETFWGGGGGGETGLGG